MQNNKINLQTFNYEEFVQALRENGGDERVFMSAGDMNAALEKMGYNHNVINSKDLLEYHEFLMKMRNALISLGIVDKNWYLKQ